MMSEHTTTVTTGVSIPIGWTDVFSCASELLDKTKPADVRWVHVERAKAIYDGIKTLFDAKCREYIPPVLEEETDHV
jgi:hypothetical protein